MDKSITEEAEKSLNLYREALNLSLEQNNYAQAYYHGINVAFLELHHLREPESACKTAQQVLDLCERAAQSEETDTNKMWRLATQGEAWLIQGDADQAKAHYLQAFNMEKRPEPWQFASTVQQALHILDRLDSHKLAQQMLEIFEGSPS